MFIVIGIGIALTAGVLLAVGLGLQHSFLSREGFAAGELLALVIVHIAEGWIARLETTLYILDYQRWLFDALIVFEVAVRRTLGV